MKCGDVFALEVVAGREVLFRLVDEHAGSFCAVLTRWEGKAPATRARIARNPALFQPQPHDHHEWDRPVLGTWVTSPPPAALRFVTNITIKKSEAARVVHPELYVAARGKDRRALAPLVVPVGAWELEQARLQWRWIHDRAALLREEEAGQRARALEFTSAINRPRQVPFANWQPRRRTAAERLLSKTRSALASRPGDALTTLIHLVKAFNRLDASANFDTPDAEEIMDAISRLADEHGLSDHAMDEIDAVREF